MSMRSILMTAPLRFAPLVSPACRRVKMLPHSRRPDLRARPLPPSRSVVRAAEDSLLADVRGAGSEERALERPRGIAAGLGTTSALREHHDPTAREPRAPGGIGERAAAVTERGRRPLVFPRRQRSPERLELARDGSVDVPGRIGAAGVEERAGAPAASRATGS